MAQSHVPHPTTRVRFGDLEADIDVEIAPLVLQLWKATVRTVLSCQDNPPGRVWLEFLNAEDLERFLTIVVGESDESDNSLYGRISWESDDVDNWWEYEITPFDLNANELAGEGDGRANDAAAPPAFVVFPSVRFPRSDLATVVTRLERFNKEQRHSC